MENKIEIYAISLPDGDVKTVVSATEAWIYMRFYIECYYADREVDKEAALIELEKECNENTDCFGVYYMNLIARKTELLNWISIKKEFNVDGFKVKVGGAEINDEDFIESIQKPY